jgi:hypothetical protein
MLHLRGNDFLCGKRYRQYTIKTDIPEGFIRERFSGYHTGQTGKNRERFVS